MYSYPVVRFIPALILIKQHCRISHEQSQKELRNKNLNQKKAARIGDWCTRGPASLFPFAKHSYLNDKRQYNTL